MRRLRWIDSIPLAVIWALASTGCASSSLVAPGGTMPLAGPLEVRFARPRTVSASWRDGVTANLDGVTAVRGRVVGVAGDTLVLRIDRDGSITRGESHADRATGITTVTFVRDSQTEVRRVLRGAFDGAASLLIVPLAVVGLYLLAFILDPPD